MIQAEYEYNYLGQQVVRRLPQTLQTIHSVHDAAGNRIAEYLYDESLGTSTLIREYIWANAQIVGVLEAGQMYYVRTDHIIHSGRSRIWSKYENRLRGLTRVGEISGSES